MGSPIRDLPQSPTTPAAPPRFSPFIPPPPMCAVMRLPLWWMKALNILQSLMRNPKEVEKTEYNEFYKKTFNEFLDPLAYTHFTTEGEVEFRSVLYVPGMAPLSNEEIMNPKTKNIRLYVKRVFISDDFDGELFPRYLSFVKGVVDSNDLPLNVSREILQESRIVRIMRKRLVRKTFDMIQEIAEKDGKEDYNKFWESFGKFMKLGCIEDTGNHKRLAPLLRFYSSKNETDLISLDQYVENMPENQKAIYYIAIDSLQSAKTAPFLEKLVQKDIEVLYLIEPIDEVAIQNLQTYKEKKFVDISKEDLELGDEDEDKEKESKQEYTLLCDWIKQQLGDKVAKVQISKRLSSSPCVLVSGKFGWSANMERLMKAQTLGDTCVTDLPALPVQWLMQLNLDMQISTSQPFLESHQPFLAQVAGFFIVEERVLRTADGLLLESQVETTWETSIGAAVNKYGYRITQLIEVLEKSRDKYHQLLLLEEVNWIAEEAPDNANDYMNEVLIYLETLVSTALLNDDVKRFTVNAVLGIDIDLKTLEAFADDKFDSTGLSDLGKETTFRDCLVEIRQLTNLLLSSQPENFMNPVIRQRNYESLDYKKLAIICEKYKDSADSLFGSLSNRNTPQQSAHLCLDDENSATRCVKSTNTIVQIKSKIGALEEIGNSQKTLIFAGIMMFERKIGRLSTLFLAMEEGFLALVSSL
ncbi:Heat shock protein 90-5, chloroplastic [Zea mays]|uniref:Heat shock protein 90-5, chloroplastic n=1 Tax=Zea mays TaxID=4577 RepID=A0A3L6DW87_MAIZE|nr:Heat shock protein 90-5, chloroplastic [Zea mays]